MKILAGTGHRPDKLGGYGQAATQKLRDFAISLLEPAKDRVQIISGMALGWDQALAWAASRLGIPWLAAVPFTGQEKMWPRESQEMYHRLLEHAREVVIVCEGSYSPSKMQIRNEYMVAHCTHVLALWNGTSGGTANCVKYAQDTSRPIINVWSKWEKFNS